MSQQSMNAPDAFAELALRDLSGSPALGSAFMKHGRELHACLVAPRSSVPHRALLRAHPTAIAWVNFVSMSPRGTVWRGRGWFPATGEEWQSLQQASRAWPWSAASTKRERDAVAALVAVLQEIVEA